MSNFNLTPEQFAAHRATVAAIKLEGFHYERNESQNRSLGYLVNDACPTSTLYFSHEWNDKGKIHVSCTFPVDRQNSNHLNTYRDEEKYPSINVSASKTSEQIAKDIQRRLLPDYLRLLALSQERIANHEGYRNSKSENGRALHAAFPVLKLNDTVNGVDYRGNKQNGDAVTLSTSYDHKPRVEIECSDKTVKVIIEGITVEEAKSILQTAFNLKAVSRSKTQRIEDAKEGN